MVAIFALTGQVISQEQVRQWLKKDGDPAFTAKHWECGAANSPD